MKQQRCLVPLEINPWVAQRRLRMALLHAVNSEGSHQVERTVQKCFPLPHVHFHGILLLQLPPPWCPGAGRYRQEQFGQAVQSDPFPLRGRHELCGFSCISFLFARLPFPGRLEKLLSHTTNPSGDNTPEPCHRRVTASCSATPVLVETP